MQSIETQYRRKSYMEAGEIYFWTATINNWQKLLLQDHYKDVIIDSLNYLSHMKKVDVFGFVIMPNHIHLTWRANELTEKETAPGSFLKFTAHKFKKMIVEEDTARLIDFKSDSCNKEYEFWQRDPLATHLYSKKVALQKLNYIHNNPLADHWKLATDPCDYKYSSARFYELRQKDFSFLTDIRYEF